MRLLSVTCIILACIATTLAEDSTRPKRHLYQWKDLLMTKLFGHKPSCTQAPLNAPVLVKEDGEVKIYKVPGYEDVLVKAVPRAVEYRESEMKEVTTEDPNIAIIQSYLGTKTPKDTIEALEGIRNLLKSGIILKPRPEAIRDAPRLQPFRVVHNPAYPPRPVPNVQVVSNVPSPFPSHYLFEQFSRDGKTTVYSSNNNGEVVVRESPEPLPLPPPYIMDIFKGIWKDLPALQSVMRPGVSQWKSVSMPPKVAGILIPKPIVYHSSPVVKLDEEVVKVPAFRPVRLYTNDDPQLLYPLPEQKVSYECNGMKKEINGPHVKCFEVVYQKPVINTQGVVDVKHSYYNQDSAKKHASTYWSSSHQTHASIPTSYSYTQYYKDGSSMTHTKMRDDAVSVVKSDELNPVQHLSEKKMEDDLTDSSESPMAYPVQPLTNTKDEKAAEKAEFVNFKENNHGGSSSKPGAIYFKKPIPSSYMFKLVNHRDQARPFTVVRVGDTYVPEAIPSLSLDERNNQTSTEWNEQFSKEYVYIPPELPSDSIPGPVPTKDIFKPITSPKSNIPSHYSYKQMSNQGVYEYSNDGKVVLKEETTSSVKPEKVSVSGTNSWSSTPISVPDQNYFYQHYKSDGSKMTVRGNSNSGVTVKTDKVDNKNDGHSRGDVPDASS